MYTKAEQAADAKRRAVALVRKRRAQGSQKRLPRQGQPDHIRASYTRALWDLTAPLGEIARKLVALVPPNPEPNAKTDAPKRSMSAELKDLEEAFNRALDRDVSKMEKVAERTARATNEYQRSEFGKQVRAAIGVELPDSIAGKRTERVVSGFVKRNVDLIKTVPERFFAEMRDVVSQDGVRHETMAKAIMERFDVSRSNATRIARDQVGKLMGQINRERQVAAGVSRFIWRTSGDERVRDEHSHLNGESFDWSRPPSEGIPGEPIQCRCSAEPDFESADFATA